MDKHESVSCFPKKKNLPLKQVLPLNVLYCTFGQDLPGRLTGLSLLLSCSVGMCVLLVHAEKELMILKVLVSYSMQVVVMGCSWNWGNVFRSDGSLPALTDWPNSCSIFQKTKWKSFVFLWHRGSIPVWISAEVAGNSLPLHLQSSFVTLTTVPRVRVRVCTPLCIKTSVPCAAWLSSEAAFGWISSVLGMLSSSHRKGLLLGGPVGEASSLIQPGDCGCRVLVTICFFFFFPLPTCHTYLPLT